MNWVIHTGDALDVLFTMPDKSVNCIITSPPYWGLRDYGSPGQYGLERTPEEYTARMVSVFREARRVLRADGTCWLNLGDSYGGEKGNNRSGLGNPKDKSGLELFGKKFPFSGRNKDLVGIPWRVAFALQADGWYLRQDIIWHKPNPMPESVKDRCTKSHEYMFLLTKSERYWYDAKAIEEAAVYDGPPRRKDSFARNVPVPPGQSPQHRENREDIAYIKTRNRRSVWSIPTTPFTGAHFATFPPKLIEPCILAGCPRGGMVLDPFIGSGTTGVVCVLHDRNCIGIELNPANVAMANERIAKTAAMGVQELMESME